jgi:hypothetical protein
MTTKKTQGSSIAALINQWGSQPDHSSYRILLQHTAGIATRLQAANSSLQEPSVTRQAGEENVYRRAGLRTPAETAIRDLFGGAAWVQRLLEAGVQSNLEVFFVRTLARRSCVPTELLSKLKVVDTSQDPWGWDDDEGEHQSVSLGDLTSLFQSLRKMLVASAEGTKPIMVVWESLSPLIMVHGFDRCLRFLEALDRPLSRHETNVRMLQVWPVRTETLTLSQHSRLEDAANALMSLNRGEMTLMRQGVRESGNIVREIMPFRLIPQEDVDRCNLLSFRLEERDEENMERDSNTPPELLDEKSSLDSSAPLTTKPQHTNPGRSRITLQLESDDHPASRTSRAETESNENRPLIYLQDNDPEFDDMDEEDPDDDLDI